MDQVWQHLAAAGPLAIVLALAVRVLWAANQEERTRHASEEDAQRKEATANLKAETDRHTSEEELLRREYVDTLKKLAGALGGNGSGHV